jgi:uncharacterized membrane protein
MPKLYVIIYTTKGKKVNTMLETILIMMAFLYSAFFSPAWLWCFPLALAIFCIKEYLKAEEKKNKKNQKRG